ncbi:cysteine-rich CWC family protein [Pseudoduganella sp. OTU4001]|uniref:cysteine-rich CWC family protein n=1 Tax=Pseudoduganella sp. OTU4001 TaxID=3043854 RepID=UPI00313B0556
MSTCERCGAEFHCAMADAAPGQKPSGAPGETPCWCTFLPPALPVPGEAAAVGCWCPDCLRAHIAALKAP